MRKLLAMVAVAVCSLGMAAFVCVVNFTIGRWILHVAFPLYWVTQCYYLCAPSSPLDWVAKVIDWAFIIIYIVPSGIYGAGIGGNWAWSKFGPAEVRKATLPLQ